MIHGEKGENHGLDEKQDHLIQKQIYFYWYIKLEAKKSLSQKYGEENPKVQKMRYYS